MLIDLARPSRGVRFASPIALLAAPVVALLVVLAGAAGSARAQPPPEHTPPESPGPQPPAAIEPAAQASAASSNIDVRASSEVAAYADSDHVYVLTPTIAGGVSNPTSGWSVNGRYLVDVVSAASVDIVSAASRRWEEVRHVGTIDGAYKPGEWGFSATGDVSSEPDYLSLTAGGAVTRDLLDKHLTLLGGLSYGHDIAGRTGTPFSVFARPLDRVGFKLGGTLIVNPSTVASLVADAMLESGDPSKPYRYVPLFLPGVDVPRGAPVETVTRLRTSARALEQLPTSRDRFALSGRVAHRFDAATLRVDERLYADSWLLFASTTDVRYLADVSRRVVLGPHWRFHAQTSVNFWQRAYTFAPGFDFPALRTGDRELGPLLNMTAGGTMRWKIGPSEHPSSWVLGFDLNATSTRYLDDIYLTHRVSGIGAISLEAEL